MNRTLGGTVAALLIALTAACGDASSGPGGTSAAASACEVAFADAAEVDEAQDAQSDLWPAFEECADLAEFTAASQEHPSVLDGVDPEIYATNQCEYEPEVAGTPVCASLD